MEKQELVDSVKEYYGKTIQNTENLQTNVCTVRTDNPTPKHIKEALKNVHDDIHARYYGCGLIAPEALENTSILDLGCGTGLDCFVLSQLVGENGQVVGVDMTDEQLDVARRYTQPHMEKFGYKKSNVEFKQGYLEKLEDADLEDEEFDILVSNCVINLTADKRAVLREAFRVMKDGGEMYFSDVYAERELSEEVRKHKVLWGECISGALFWKTLYALAKEIGFSRPRIVASGLLAVDEKFKEVLGDAEFTSTTFRLFKLPVKLPTCGPQMATYNGGILGHEEEFILDIENKFRKEVTKGVDSETADVLATSRFAKYFTFEKASCSDESSCCPTAGDIDPFEIARKGGAPSACGAQACC